MPKVEIKTLRELRVIKSFTQKELAARTGVSVATYNLIENGKRRGSQKFWLSIQEIFNLDGGEVWKLQNN